MDGIDGVMRERKRKSDPRKAPGCPDHALAKPAPAGPVTDADAPEPGATDELGGPKGPEPTRYGDWERKGRCIDF